MLLDWLWHECSAGDSHTPVLRGEVQDAERQRPTAMQAVGTWFVLQPVCIFVLCTVRPNMQPMRLVVRSMQQLRE